MCITLNAVSDSRNSSAKMIVSLEPCKDFSGANLVEIQLIDGPWCEFALVKAEELKKVLSIL